MKIPKEGIWKWIHRVDEGAQIVNNHMNGPVVSKIRKVASVAQKLAGFRNALSEVAKKVGKQ